MEAPHARLVLRITPEREAGPTARAAAPAPPAAASRSRIGIGVLTRAARAPEPLLRVEPVARIDAALPLEPERSGLLGVQVVLDLEAQGARELRRTAADDQVVVRELGSATALATRDGVRTPSIPATPPAHLRGPCIRHESSWTTPSALGRPP